MQWDANFVIYCTKHGLHRAIWSTLYGYAPLNGLYFKHDGKLAIYNFCNKQQLWATHPHPGAQTLIMQSDGNLVMYNSQHRPLWASHTPGRC